MLNKKRFWIVFVVASVLLVVLILGGFVVVYNRLELVNRGLAKPTFPYTRYSQDELNNLYPQYVNVDVATIQTPIETHRLFVDRLKEGDFDGATECCFERKNWDGMKEALRGIEEDGDLPEMIKDLDVELEVNILLDTIATYEYHSEESGGIIEFIKNSDGVWLIESL